MSRHFLVIGGQRCGTTYLYSLLDEHPDIVMARPMRPEPKVFLSEEQSRRGKNWYLQAFFSHGRDESLFGEKSTSYIEDARAPARVKEMMGSIKIIVLVRDPIDRAVSNWRFSTDNGFEGRPVTTALEDNLARTRAWERDSTSVSPFAYLERGRYADYLAPWYEAFPGEIRIELLPEVVSSQQALAGLYGWLGVDREVVPPSFGRRVNESNQPTSSLSDGLVVRLRAYFSDTDKALSRLIGRELPW